MRFAKLAATAAALLLTASACGGADGSGDERTAARTPATLNVWMVGDGTPEQTRFLDGVEAEFRRRHPNTDVAVRYVPWPQATTTFQLAAAGGAGPDVTEVGNSDVQSHIEQGNLADISELVERWPDAAAINKIAMANDRADGKTYAVPWYGGVRGVWYRRDWFQELDLRPPGTWEELRLAARRIQDAKNVPGFGTPRDQTNRLVSFIWGNGGEIATRDGDRWVGRLDQPQVREAVEFYAELVSRDGVAPEKYIGKNELQGPQRDFALGRLGMYIDGSWALKEMKKISGRDAARWGVFPIPGRTGGAAPVMAGGSDLAVWHTSKAVATAFDYITVLGERKNALEWADYSGFSSMRTDVRFTDPALGAFTGIAGNTKMPPIGPGWAEFEGAKKVLPNTIKGIMQGSPADQELRKANDQANALLNP